MIDFFMMGYGAATVFFLWPMMLCLAVSWSMPGLVIGYIAEIIWCIVIVKLIPMTKKEKLSYGERLLVGK
jgi:hypothetical protein